MGDEVKDDEVESDEAKEKEREESKSRGRKTQSLCSPSFLNALTQLMQGARRKTSSCASCLNTSRLGRSPHARTRH